MPEQFDLKEYEKRVIEIAKSRKRAHGEQFNEVDFFCGAMVVHEYLGKLGNAPARWIFCPMMGESILEDE